MLLAFLVILGVVGCLQVAYGQSAAINLTPASGPVGTSVTIAGSGFPVNSNVNITFASTVIGAGVPTDSSGSFTLTFTVPKLAPGTYTILAYGISGNIGSATFTIPSGSITLNPSSAVVGGSVTISGANFGSNSNVNISLASNVIGAGVPTNGLGSFGFTFVVPSLTPGSYTVQAYGLSGNVASATLTVLSGDFTVSASPSVISILASDSASSSVTLTSIAGFAGQVTLVESVSPVTGLAASLSSSSVVLGTTASSTLTVTGVTTGTYLVTISATGGGVTHTTTVSVSVLSAQQALQLTKNQVKALQSSNVLTSGQANSLLTKLQSAINYLNSGNTKNACSQLGAFVNQVNSYVATGVLTTAQANTLLGGPEGVLAVTAVLHC